MGIPLQALMGMAMPPQPSKGRQTQNKAKGFKIGGGAE